jgi:hypothetical protein
MDYAALKTELQTDPQTVGYAAPLAAGDHVTVAGLLNAVPTAAADGPYTVNDENIDGGAARAAIPDGELTTITAEEKAKLEWYFGGTTVSNSANVRTFIQGSSLSGTTKTALQTLTERGGSRAENLFGINTRVSHTDIAVALAS